jgi:serine/threonine protein kinase
LETACPSENELLARAAGKLSIERTGRVDAHVDVCADCRLLLAEAAAVIAEPLAAAEREPPITFAPREIIADRYVVIRWLASGGMGEVYEVHDTWLDENVALKTIVAAIADDSRALARLKAELRAARRVTHANVCRVYDLGFCTRGNGQVAFLTMELLRGVTLRQRLLTNGPFDREVARPVIAQMAEALRHAHAAGIVHRDFKSDNVMLVLGSRGELSRVVVMDFGLARQSLVGLSQPLTPQSRTVFGTLDYMSPEQLMGRPATPESDIYSLGIVVYELLTGRLPFEGESPLARALKRVTERAPSLGKELPPVPHELVSCVARCLQTEKSERFATVDDFLGALAGKHTPRKFSRRTSRRIALSLIGSAVVVLVLAGWKWFSPAPEALPDAIAGSLLRTQTEDERILRLAAPVRPAISEVSVEAAVATTSVAVAVRPPPPPARIPKRSTLTVSAPRTGSPIAASSSPNIAAADSEPSGDPGAAAERSVHRTGARDALLDPFAAGPPRPRVGGKPPPSANPLDIRY